MYYTIYKTTNLINGKIYIGKHQTSNLNDSYLGSGKGIKNAVKKYGRENFRKDILFVFESEKEMNAKEKELITEELPVTDKLPTMVRLLFIVTLPENKLPVIVPGLNLAYAIETPSKAWPGLTVLPLTLSVIIRLLLPLKALRGMLLRKKLV